jgi:drug/metabolite transporter (DMT)-like permease
MTRLPLRPLAFVLLWSTGYVAGPLALRDAEPFTLLALRLGAAAVALAGLALVSHAAWPRSPRALGHLAVAGLLVQVLQFGGLYAAIKLGLPAGVAAVILGLMPILTAFAAGLLLGELLTLMQWCGLVAGFGGVVLVVGSGLARGAITHVTTAGVGLAVLALGGVAAGSVYQKRFCSTIDARTGAAVQSGIAALVMLALARGTETMHVVATPSFWLALVWLVVANSIVATLLLFTMIRDGEVNRVATTFYLIPPVAAVLTALVLHERFTALAVVGFVLAAAGVALATRAARPAQSSSAIARSGVASWSAVHWRGALSGRQRTGRVP